MGDAYLKLQSYALPVHKASVKKELMDKNQRVVSNCHSLVIRNVGTNPIKIDGETFKQGEFYHFTPPILNVIDTTTYQLEFQEIGGTNEVWVTRSVIDFCFE